MATVTQVVERTAQPKGGYIPPSWFEKTQLEDGESLCEVESVHPSTVGLAVDYLTRFIEGCAKEEAFAISLKGAKLADKHSFRPKNYLEKAEKLLQGISSLDDDSIKKACKLVVYDVWYRNPFNAYNVDFEKLPMPDKATRNNIRTMVNRSHSFFQKYGPVTQSGFTFDNGGYTDLINKGEGDFLTKDTLWDFKVSKKTPTSKQTLQLLIYWIMGQHSGKPEYRNIHKLGIFNPRLNRVYLFDVASLNIETIQEVEKMIIGYEQAFSENDYAFSFMPIPQDERPKQETHWSEEKKNNQRKIRMEELQQQIKSFDYELIRYTTTVEPVVLKCKKCGNEWETTKYKMKAGSTKCPRCYPCEQKPQKKNRKTI